MFFFKQKTAYEMRISDWSSDVCSSDLLLLCGRVFSWLYDPIICDRIIYDRIVYRRHKLMPRVACLGDVVDIGTRRLKRDIHVGDLCLHQLKRPDRLAELGSFAHVRNEDRKSVE